MATLHTVNRSPFESSALTSCLRLARPGSGILLLEDAVVAAIEGGTWGARVQQACPRFSIYALAADVSARGLSGKLLPDIRVIDDAGFVQLAIEHDKVVSWS